MTSIRDKELAASWERVLAARAGVDQTPLRDDELLDLLAAVGDQLFRNAAAARAKLDKAGSLRDLLDVLQGSVSNSEAQDIGRILDSGAVRLSPFARQVLELAAGRRELDLTRDDAGQPQAAADFALARRLRGALASQPALRAALQAGARVELSNASTAHLSDQPASATFATVDDSGRLSATLTVPTSPLLGDALRLSVVDSAGVRTSHTLRPPPGAAAARELELTTDKQGRVTLPNQPQLGLPGALVRLENLSTRQRVEAVLDKYGRVPEQTVLPGTAGQRLAIAVLDERAPQLRLSRLSLAPLADGTIAIRTPDGPAGEPGALLRLTNGRTRQQLDIVLDADGRVPAGVAIAGQAGDELRVAVSDGAHNLDFGRLSGRLLVPAAGAAASTADLAEPDTTAGLLPPDPDDPIRTTRFTGPLVRDTIAATDVVQGQIGDCYFAASAAAVAQAAPEQIARRIQHNQADGTFTVTFSLPDPRDGRLVEVPVLVDGDLWTRHDEPVYGSSAGPDRAPDRQELWFPLLEKAYAQLHGSYAGIDDGGWPTLALTALTGQPARTLHSCDFTEQPARLFEQLAAALAAGHPVTATTRARADCPAIAQSPFTPLHAHTVLAAERDPDGSLWLTIRNPHNRDEQSADNRGIRRVALADYLRYFLEATTTLPERPAS